MNFSSLQSSVQKFGMNQALKYLEKDPETNIPKLMNLVDKVMPEGWYGSQRKVIREQIDEKGEVQNVSIGTGMGDSLDFYRNIGITAMPYGQSLTVLCLTELLVSYC